MKLYEFFGKINLDTEQSDDQGPGNMGKEEKQELGDQVFWHIVDHDDLHKSHFMPIANHLTKALKADSKAEIHDWKIWMDMVKEGCQDFYKENPMPGDPRELFDKKFRIEICKRLAEHYHEDIIKGEYKLGH